MDIRDFVNKAEMICEIHGVCKKCPMHENNKCVLQNVEVFDLDEDIIKKVEGYKFKTNRDKFKEVFGKEVTQMSDIDWDEVYRT